ncbi:unnamed protein product [marine sediment metagenome]|uniref:Uncharacterized protein n=1 Tax=marine sediment metagenome TaxID=412755 RepID=X1AWF6_9ZZZZ
MAKKKIPKEPENDEIPDGKVDEDGDEILDLDSEKDDLTDDVIYDLNKIDDEMLADETEEEEFGYEVDEVEKMLRKIKCEPCSGSDSKPDCKVRDDYGCPPGKETKKKPWTDAERRAAGKKSRKN